MKLGIHQFTKFVGYIILARLLFKEGYVWPQQGKSKTEDETPVRTSLSENNSLVSFTFNPLFHRLVFILSFDLSSSPSLELFIKYPNLGALAASFL
jgi:hypothetical protein